MTASLRAPLTARSVDLCIDMQRLFTAERPRGRRRGWTGCCRPSSGSRSGSPSDRLLAIYRERYSEKIEAAESETILSAWPEG